MSQRTSPAAVQTLLGNDWGGGGVQPYIDAATTVVDDLVTAAAGLEPAYAFTPAKAEIIERYLAAHFYTKTDPTYTSKSTGGASGSFVRNPKEPEPYKDAAMQLDPTGMLNALLNRQRARLVWLGKPPSAQVPFYQRD